MTITIEDASITYLGELYQMEVECFKKEAFTKQQIAYLLTDYSSISLVAKEDGNIVGFVIGRIHAGKKSLAGHILTIDVSPTHRHRGIAQKLLEEIEKIFRNKGVKECQLEAREDNVAALKLYEKLGYERIEKLENYYGNAHGIYLRKTLT
jgi:ribosomal-protein-alanine acetyltransferase